MGRNQYGPAPRYTSKEEIIDLIDKYFEDCKGKPFTDPDTGRQMVDKYGYPIFIGQRPPTVTGLALALGFKSRQSLLNYGGKKEFRDTIMEAKSRIEMYVEERLLIRTAPTVQNSVCRTTLRAGMQTSELRMTAKLRLSTLYVIFREYLIHSLSLRRQNPRRTI